MTITSASDAIETLLAMSQNGEIDPWDVQVVDVIDRFLSELGFSDQPDLDWSQAHLPQSGQAFLWAAMLVLFKADTLERNEDPEELESGEDNLLSAEGHRLPQGLERRLRRRTAAPPPRKRRVTLEELIAQLRDIAAEIETSPAPPPMIKKRPRPQSRREAINLITELAHQENLTELAQQLEGFLRRRLPQQIDFEELLHLWGRETAVNPNSERVGVFWALLLLGSQSKVELSQDQFYQDLKIDVIPELIS
ncbi:MAG: hypothetical protein N5P05_003245 [Chroococcopsis gigantea SAG 12.99]|jgi:segregation and condensation protein A|nr:segregation/condensation protein A [Chlorogloea purpurea SAG 13.99]MDV3001639.1 hypothetical protein [Chroococcopsis gigantea SAG 12.99]